MGAFNTVTASVACPVCGQVGRFDVQYKYGNTWQYHYDVGATVAWGGNDVGQPGKKRVLVEGLGGPCLHCGVDNIEFDITLERDKITSVHAIGVERKEHHPNGFSVMED